MRLPSSIKRLIRSLVFVGAVVTTMASTAAPAFAIQIGDESPEARAGQKTTNVIEIRAGELPGRMVDGDQIDVKGCLRSTISDSLRPGAVNTTTLSTQDSVKPGVFLCGDGVAIENQVIISGQPGDLSRLAELKTGLQLTAQLVKTNPDQLRSEDIGLYTITDGTPLVEKVKTLNLYLRDRMGINVIATPNYETASKRTSVDGGSPSIGGSPSGPKGLPSTEAEFKKQWAFEAISKPVTTTPAYTGKGVVVGIFDAFCQPAPYLDKEGKVINVTRYAFIGAQAKTDPKTHKPIEDVCAHGEFVWSLSHEVAPDAQYFFYPVLDESGLGDTATLVGSIERFISNTMALPERKGMKDLQGVVVNFSLNVNSAQGDVVRPLQVEIDRLSKLGAVVVGAAGNDSNTGNGIQPMRLPAAYASVIAVAATQKDNQRASYSDWVPAGRLDVAAPGGDGDCRKTKEAPNCVIGKDSSATKVICRSTNALGACFGRSIVKTGYRAWSGTSFATPLVSGLAALLLEKNKNAISPLAVAQALATNANPAAPAVAGSDEGIGQGVINIENTIQ
ncbi:MAG TPA: S8/S53 family peptidase [Anaerolineae bacterium]